MNPLMLDGIVTLVGAAMCIGALLLFAGLCFPSLRSALVERLRGHGQGPIEAVLLAEVRALRGEVYALRCEVAPLAGVSQALGLPAAGGGGAPGTGAS
jgi:hypothetical protein